MNEVMPNIATREVIKVLWIKLISIVCMALCLSGHSPGQISAISSNGHTYADVIESLAYKDSDSQESRKTYV